MSGIAVYVVTAYRAGQRDNHSYVVGAELDAESAKAVADAETAARGGKYGAEVIRVLVGASKISRQVYYTAACYEGQWGTGKEPAQGWDCTDGHPASEQTEFKCSCEDSPGWTTVRCCNVCGLPLPDEPWAFRRPLPKKGGAE